MHHQYAQVKGSCVGFVICLHICVAEIEGIIYATGALGVGWAVIVSQPIVLYPDQ